MIFHIGFLRSICQTLHTWSCVSGDSVLAFLMFALESGVVASSEAFRFAPKKLKRMSVDHIDMNIALGNPRSTTTGAMFWNFANLRLPTSYSILRCRQSQSCRSARQVRVAPLG